MPWNTGPGIKPQIREWQCSRSFGLNGKRSYFYVKLWNAMTQSSKDLLKRIAGLARQNQEYLEENEKLKRLNEALENSIEELREKLKSLESKGIRAEVPKEDLPVNIRFNMVTVMYARIHGFSNISEEMNSAQIMDELDEVLFHFDSILKKYKIHKIKTIGDSYMAAGGIPHKNITNPIDVVMASLEMHQYLDELHRNSGREKKIWELKIGIHTGPVTAGISGKKKLNYDLKGDTVNMATRLETYARSGETVVSVMTYELVKEFFNCEYHGKMPVKYKKDLELFNVKSILGEYTLNGDGKTPNKNFDIKFKLIQFTDIQEIILDKLEKELPSYLYYHNVKHTVDVVTEVELIGWAEGVSDEEILLLKMAGLFHDAGHTVAYDNHEYHGTVLVKEYLPAYGYNEEQINTICETIMATKLPPQPKTLLQQIICDSDLDYLGRSDMIPVSNTLYKELKEQNKIGTLNDWNKLQVKFISGHQYFTKTARQLREVNKQSQIERIKALITED
jgi:class 3 adenylate cyclase